MGHWYFHIRLVTLQSRAIIFGQQFGHFLTHHATTPLLMKQKQKFILRPVLNIYSLQSFPSRATKISITSRLVKHWYISTMDYYSITGKSNDTWLGHGNGSQKHCAKEVKGITLLIPLLWSLGSHRLSDREWSTPPRRQGDFLKV